MRARLVAVCALLFASTAFAQAYNYLDYRMLNNAQDPFPYWVNDVQTGGLQLSAVIGATQGAFQAWDDVGCASTAFSYQGIASPQIADPSDPNDAFSVSTTFITDENDPLYQYALGGVARGASVELTYAGVVYQCDIYLNDVLENPDTHLPPRWTTVSPTPDDGYDVETFVAHEVGHCQGLDHTLGIDDIMRPDLTEGIQLRTPSPADQGALCNAYPVDGQQGSPCPPASCDSGLGCATAPRADGGTFPAICAQGCTPGDPNTTCPLPFVCRPSSDVPGFSGACLPVDGNQTQVGKDCAGTDDCGSALGICEDTGTLPSGFYVWPGGYCSQDCTNNACPAESACTHFGDGSDRCLKTCRVGSGDCRTGYVCAQTNAASVPVCIVQCHADGDCADGYQCRTCDGTCLAVQTPTAGIGTSCTVDSQCGFGETCFLNGAATGVCTQSCATTCGACPGGTSCHPVGPTGDLMCLRDCTPGSCATGEQCADSSTGKGCMPGCTSSSQCPVGDVCNGGECVLQAPPDAGCTSCTPPDAGTHPPPTPDAGTGAGPSSGGAFGCAAAGQGGAMPWWPLLLGVFLFTRRGRAWRS